MWPFQKVRSFAVEKHDGQVVFFEANRVRIQRGRLVFLSGWHTIVGAVKEGEWIRVQAGVTLADFRNS